MLKVFKDSECQDTAKDYPVDGFCMTANGKKAVICCSPDESMCEAVVNRNKQSVRIISHAPTTETAAPNSATQTNINPWVQAMLTFLVLTIMSF